MFELSRRLSRLLCAGVMLSCAACSPVTLSFDDPLRPPLLPVASASSTGLLAWNPSGSMIAVDNRGLALVDLDKGRSQRLSDPSPGLAAWGTPGLAVASVHGETASLRLVRSDAPGKGSGIESVEFDGVVTAMTWSRTGLLYALVNRHAYYQFGINQRTLLLRWRPGQEPTWEQLSDVTLDRSTPTLVGERFPFGPQLELSPLEDEILYSRLHDPPAFPAEYRVFVRHLETGKERMIGRHGLNGGEARLLPDGESALLAEGSFPLRKLPLWGEGEEGLPLPSGPTLEVAGELVYVGGGLYRGSERLWQLTRPFPGRFSPDGSRLAILSQGQLYVLDTAATTSGVEPPSPSAKLLKLRRLRALELISPAEYRRYREE